MNARLRALGYAMFLSCTACHGPLGAAEPRYGVCRQEMIDFVTHRLGQTPTRIEIQAYAERNPPVTLFDAGSALVYVEECDGFHGFEIRATEDLCEHIPHYGRSRPSYVFYEGPFEGCRKG